MTPEQQAAFIQSQTACMLAELEAMKAENEAAMAMGFALVHEGPAFRALPDKHGVGHNAVVGFFRQ